MECYLEITAQLWPSLCAGALPPGTPQVKVTATYSHWRDEADYRIDWHRDSAYLRRFVDALGAPYRGLARGASASYAECSLRRPRPTW